MKFIVENLSEEHPYRFFNASPDHFFFTLASLATRFHTKQEALEVLQRLKVEEKVKSFKNLTILEVLE